MFHAVLNIFPNNQIRVADECLPWKLYKCPIYFHLIRFSSEFPLFFFSSLSLSLFFFTLQCFFSFFFILFSFFVNVNFNDKTFCFLLIIIIIIYIIHGSRYAFVYASRCWDTFHSTSIEATAIRSISTFVWLILIRGTTS